MSWFAVYEAPERMEAVANRMSDAIKQLLLVEKVCKLTDHRSSDGIGRDAGRDYPRVLDGVAAESAPRSPASRWR